MTMTNEQLDEAVKRIAWLDSKICEAIAAIDAGYSERKDIEWERAEANLCNEARAMAKILDQLWDEREIAPHPITDLQCWDCHGWDFSTVQYEYLREMGCEYRKPDGTLVPASYWFTLDHTDNGFSQYPPEHKCYHLLLLEDEVPHNGTADLACRIRKAQPAGHSNYKGMRMGWGGSNHEEKRMGLGAGMHKAA